MYQQIGLARILLLWKLRSSEEHRKSTKVDISIGFDSDESYEEDTTQSGTHSALEILSELWSERLRRQWLLSQG